MNTLKPLRDFYRTHRWGKGPYSTTEANVMAMLKLIHYRPMGYLQSAVCDAQQEAFEAGGAEARARVKMLSDIRRVTCRVCLTIILNDIRKRLERENNV